MPLIIEQSFPLGRYHATRWNQNPFEDRHGEWPPSPWRLLRALAARWFQYSRETGDEEETARDALLTKLAEYPPVFQLPDFTWRGDPAPRQYQKTEVTWTDASAKSAAYKKPKTTLTIDVFHAVSPADQVIWLWEDLELSDRLKNLLRELLKRILYFGRAESHCRFQIREEPVEGLSRCELSQSNNTGSPVLVATPGEYLNLESLLASSSDKLFKGRQIPPGTTWHYVCLPSCPTVRKPPRRRVNLPNDIQVIQFAVGGRVFPEQKHWVRVVEKFRGCVLKHAARIVSERQHSSYRELPPDLSERLALLSGKDGKGQPTRNHSHAYFFLCPDESGHPTRLIVYRHTPFDGAEIPPFEVEAILAASQEPIFWHSRDPDWSLRMVPLPFETPPPSWCGKGGATSKFWMSAVPFVAPQRHRFRGNGRLRVRETASELLRKSLYDYLKMTHPAITVVGIQLIDEDEKVLSVNPDQDPTPSKWMTVHESLSERYVRLKSRTRRVLPGFRFHVEFSEPVHGPLLVGHSCHFGLGLFVPADGAGVARLPE